LTAQVLQSALRTFVICHAFSFLQEGAEPQRLESPPVDDVNVEKAFVPVFVEGGSKPVRSLS